MPRPRFLITIDTEGDNLWSRPRRITTANSRYLARFQSLCEAHDLRPTYLTTYEMATCPVFREFGRDLVRRGAGEIGMHLHAWNSPPLQPLTADDFHHQPYLIEYPAAVMLEKIRFLTDLLAQAFETPITSHRAGRWALNETYARLLSEAGYVVDCTVTPGISWRSTLGDPAGGGGSDYSRYPRSHYFLDLDHLNHAGSSGLLEVPMTVAPRPAFVEQAIERYGRFPAHLLKRLYPVRWLRPTGANRKDLLWILDWAERQGCEYVEFMLHSSEFMPGGSPVFPNEAAIERLYADLKVLFGEAERRFAGTTLTEFARQVCACPHA
jgi:hypothetical protein